LINLFIGPGIEIKPGIGPLVGALFLPLTDLTVRSGTSDQISCNQNPISSHAFILEGLILPPKYGLAKFNEVWLTLGSFCLLKNATIMLKQFAVDGQGVFHVSTSILKLLQKMHHQYDIPPISRESHVFELTDNEGKCRLKP
jgi:hypothetical protein